MVVDKANFPKSFQHFFGEIRSACGSGSHPDTKLFVHLLSAYSVIKTPRGSNVPGSELLQSILELKEIVGEANSRRREEIESKIDLILDEGMPKEFHNSNDHSYLDKRIDPQALTVLAGYVSRKMRALELTKSCPTCFNAVCVADDEPPAERETFLNLKSYGGLFRPSEDLFQMVFKVCFILNILTSQMIFS